MPDSRFAELAQQLLDDGVSPKFVSRLERELEAHLEDLRLSALSRQKSTEAADLEAVSRLGDVESIAMLFRERPELRLWIYKWPWAAVINLVAGVILSIQWPALLVVDNRASLARVGGAAVLGVGMTVVVFFVMVSLILTADDFSLTLDARQRMASFNVNRISTDDERPVERRSRAGGTGPVALPVGRIVRPADVGQLVSVDRWLDGAATFDLDAVSRPKLVVSIDGNLGIGPGDGEYLATLKVAPTYPKRALQRGLEGYVIVKFTITRVGTVKDIEVVESSDRIFESSTTDAVSKFRYRPRVVSGEPREVPNVRNRILYELEA